MRALIADADWAPRAGYKTTGDEERTRRAYIGSQVWRNTRFEIKEIPVPVIGGDEVLVKVKSCGVCGSDSHLYETDKDGYILFSGLTKLPCVLGHEFSGEVVKAGPRVKGLKEGDIVAMESVMWCGMCEPCRSGAPNQCRNVELMGLSSDGAFAEYAAVNERYCWKINDLKERFSDRDVFDIGALIEPVGCAYNGMFVVGGGFNPGAVVAVYGTGPIGLGAVALARTAGASLIIAFDVNDGRVEIAKQMGADHAFNIKKMNGQTPSQRVLELTKGLGADIQVEAAGAAPHTIPEMEKSLSSQGKIIYLGRAATSTPMFLDALVTGANKVIGARGHSGYGIFPHIIRLLSRGRLEIRPMISSRFRFENIKDALKESVNRDGGKVIVNMD